MLTIYDLVEKCGKGQGEGKMWASVAVISDALEPMKEADKEKILVYHAEDVRSNERWPL